MSLLGKTIGHIRIVGVLGGGGMGDVYEGLDETLERKVAVKAIRAKARLDTDVRRPAEDALSLVPRRLQGRRPDHLAGARPLHDPFEPLQRLADSGQPVAVIILLKGHGSSLPCLVFRAVRPGAASAPGQRPD